jgi:hypothetical protein
MANGTLKLYNKLTNVLLVSLDILGTFNIEDNLNETPSNMKVKVITSNTYREEFEVNTVAYHEDTNSWWVIKSDESTYLMTGEYEHEIQLVEYLEFYAYRHLPNCAFAPNIYTLEQMLLRLFDIAKLSISVNYPTFLDQSKIMPFFSFENFTVANAIKNISRAINAIPKMSINLSGFVPTLTFINRNGIDNAIVDNLNTQFPIAYEKNTNSSDQFLTRSVSNVTNAKSSSLVIAPLNGGFKNIVPDNLIFDSTTRLNAKVFLPSKIDRIEYVNVLIPYVLIYTDSSGNTTVLFDGYVTDREKIVNIINGITNLTLSERQQALNNLTSIETFYRVNYNAPINKNFVPAFNVSTQVGDKSNVFNNKMSLLSKFEFDTVSKVVSGVTSVDTDKKERTIHWLPNTNEVVMSLSLRNSLTSIQDHNNVLKLFEDSGSPRRLVFDSSLGTIKNEQILVQVAYYPIADIKVSIDNDNDAQDEKFFNQSGKVIDAVSVSKLITSHTNDSVEGTKIRNARYDKFPYQLFTGFIAFSISPPLSPLNGYYWFRTDTSELYLRISDSWVLVSSTFGTTTPVDGNQSSLKFVNTTTQQLFISQLLILPLGQLVRDSNQIYIITQRSIDGQVKDNNEYYNVIYTLSRNRVARSENIVADSSVISYKTPDDNLVFRSQLYKDYIELSLENINQDTPYLSMSKALVLSDTLAGTNFDYTVLARNTYGSPISITRYVKSPTTFDLHKSKLINVNWQDNNVIGFRFDRASGVLTNTLVQTPILYTDNVGKATNFEVLFVNKQEINQANLDYNSPTVLDPLVPFGDLTEVPFSFYSNNITGAGNFSIRIQEPNYAKDPFEIPVFEYMIQGNDDYNSLGNIVIGNDLFTTLSGNIRYHYLINNSTRFTAENADGLYLANPPGNLTNRRAGLARPSGTQIQMILYSTFDPNASPFPILTQNTSSVTNVGIYAVDGNTGTIKFLFAINDYTMASVSTFNIYINNWKI